LGAFGNKTQGMTIMNSEGFLEMADLIRKQIDDNNSEKIKAIGVYLVNQLFI